MGRKRDRPPIARDYTGLQPTRPTLRLVIDEMLGTSALRAVEERGAELIYIREVMLGAEDEDVVKFADMKRAAVLTLNVHHFRSMLSRYHQGEHRKYQHAGLIGLVCEPASVPARLAAVWDFIEAEHAVAAAKSGPAARLFLEIGNEWARTYR